MKYLLSIITVTHFSVVLIAQTSFLSGCYYTIEQVMSRSPQDSLLCLVYKHSKDDSKHYGSSGFMNEQWDKSVPSPNAWNELLTKVDIKTNKQLTLPF